MPGPAGVFAAGHGGPLASLSLFSGCGALDLGLARWCHPVAYCEACPAAARVLRARMADGALPEAPLHPDVRRLHAADLRGVVDGVVMGFPCQDISGAGGRAGLVGARSALVFEGVRLADETRCRFVLLENVNSIRGMLGVWGPIFEALGRLGFSVEWCTVGACHVGSPQRRLRWFALARRGDRGADAGAAGVSAAAPAAVRRDGRLPQVAGRSGLRFNGGRPAPERWLLPQEAHADVAERLNMLGDAVVPLQASLAADLLGLDGGRAV